MSSMIFETHLRLAYQQPACNELTFNTVVKLTTTNKLNDLTVIHSLAVNQTQAQPCALTPPGLAVPLAKGKISICRVS